MVQTNHPHHKLTLRLARATLDHLHCPNITADGITIAGRHVVAVATSGARYLIVVAERSASEAGVTLSAVHRERQKATCVAIDADGRASRGLRTIAYWGESSGPSARQVSGFEQWRPHSESPWRPLP